MRFLLALALLLALSPLGSYSEDLSEVPSEILLDELMKIIEQQENLLKQQRTQISELKTELSEAKSWLTLSDMEIKRLLSLQAERELLWKNYVNEVKRKMAIRNIAIIGLSVSLGGSAGLNIYQAVK